MVVKLVIQEIFIPAWQKFIRCKGMILYPRASDFEKYLRPLLVTYFAPKKQVLLAGQYHLLLSNKKVFRPDFWTYVQQKRYNKSYCLRKFQSVLWVSQISILGAHLLISTVLGAHK